MSDENDDPDAWRDELTPDPSGLEAEIAPDGADASEPDGGSGGNNVEGAGTAIVRLRVAPDAVTDRAAARFPLTDLGNAERFVLRHGADLRFCAELGWFRWDARRWELLSEEKDKLPAAVMQLVFATIRAIKNEAVLVRESGMREPCPDHFDDGARAAHEAAMEGRMDYVMSVGSGPKKAVHYSDKIAEWARSSESAARLGCVGLLAKSFTGIAVAVTDFDADRMAINCQNGTLRILRQNKKRSSAEIALGKSEWHNVWSIKLAPHDRADLITKITRVD